MANTDVGFKINIEGIDNIDQLNQAIKDTQKSLNGLTIGTEEYTKQAEKLAKLKAEQAGIKKQQDDLNKSFRETSSSLGAYDQLSARLNKLRKEYKDLAVAGKDNSKTADDLRKEIIALDTQLKGVDASVGQFQRNVGNYGSATKGFGAKLSEFGDRAAEASSALGGIGGPAGMAIKALQGIGVAVRFALGPIGLIIIAIGLIVGAIKQFFVSSEEGQNAARKLGAVFSSVFGVISDVVSEVGKAIFVVIDAIGKGINNLTILLGKSENTLVKVANKAAQLADQQAELDKRERESLVKTASLRQDIEKLKTDAVDKEKFSVQERLKFIDEAINKENQIMKIEEDLAQRNLNNIKLQNSLRKKTKDDLKAEAQAEAALINVKTANATKEKELISQRIGFLSEIKAEEKAAADAQKKIYEEQLAKQKEIADARKKFQEDEIKLQEAALQLQKTITEKTNTIITNLIEDEFEKRRQLLEQNTRKELEAIEKTLSDQKKANKERLNEALKLYNANAKEVKVLNETIKTEETKALEESTKLKNAIELQAAKETEKINKDQSEKFLELKKKEFEAIKAVDQRNFEDQRNLLEKSYNEQLKLAGDNAKEIEKINAQYQSDLFQLEKQRIQDEIDLNTYKINTIEGLNQDEKDAIISQNIKFNADLAKLDADRTKNAKEESKKRTEIEQKEVDEKWADLNEKIQLAGKFTQIALETVSGFLEASDQKRMERLEKDAEANQQIQDNLNERLQTATGLERRYLEQQLEASVKNAETIAKQKQKLEKDAAKRKKATAVIESIINTALAVSSALATPPAPNIIAGVIAGIAGAAQTAVIAAQPLAKGGVVGKGDDIVQFANGGRVTNRGNIKPLSNGDNVLATLKTGEIVLNESQQRRIGYASLKRAQIPNFANGGLVGAPTSLISNANNTIASEQMRVNLMDEMVKATNQRIDRLTVVYTATTDFEVEKGRNDKKTIKANSTF
jgi:hypothetical protein